jgi:vesicle-fusing ATPase
MASDIPSQPPHLASNPFLDLSGIDTTAFANPYDALLEASQNDSRNLQERYSTHRTTRNAQQKAKLLAKDFSGVIVDPILQLLEDGKSVEEGYVDPRHCLVFWGRPEEHIRTLIGEVQQRLRKAAPSLWLMPKENLHITILEITHSKTAEEIELLKQQIAPVAEPVVNYTKAPNHRARLIKPMVGFDASALALSFVPAAGEGDDFSYHHLRRDVFDMVTGAGVKVDSRYVVPSAHLTIGRFVTQEDFAKEDGSVDPKKMEDLIQTIEDVNAWLQEQYWQDEGDAGAEGGWTVGEGDGVVLRWGTVWYGGGTTMAQTKHE